MVHICTIQTKLNPLGYLDVVRYSFCFSLEPVHCIAVMCGKTQALL